MLQVNLEEQRILTFANFNITVGGKTGSAQIGVNGEQGAHAWFVGFAPYEDPEIAVVVLVEKVELVDIQQVLQKKSWPSISE